MRYGHVEAALAAVLDVKDANMGAFRARLRHLRNIGVAKLPKPGSGEAITYTETHAFELLIAVELERIGQAPRTAARFAQSIVDNWSRKLETEDRYLVIGRSEERYMVATDKKHFPQFLDKAPNTFSVINLGACFRSLRAELERVQAD